MFPEELQLVNELHQGLYYKAGFVLSEVTFQSQFASCIEQSDIASFFICITYSKKMSIRQRIKTHKFGNLLTVYPKPDINKCKSFVVIFYES